MKSAKSERFLTQETVDMLEVANRRTRKAARQGNLTKVVWYGMDSRKRALRFDRRTAADWRMGL